jgi:23S rRNA pseudouridine2605 synthase
MNTNKAHLDSLSKYLAQAGVASRRKVVDIIKSKIVTVNGVMVSEPGFKVNKGDLVRIRETIVRAESKIYLLLNKPKNCITTASDDLGRHSVLDIIPDRIKERIYPVGRLDRNTTGVLLLTNDGDLAVKLSHPRYEVEKIYTVKLNKPFTRNDMRLLLNGVQLEDGLVVVDQARYLPDRSKDNVILALHSGKNRVVRRLFEALGYDVQKLDRSCFAGFSKGGLSAGEWRHLTSEEITSLKNL